jgi:hypothetical protein
MGRHDWERLYHAAILETDWGEMKQHIEAAYSGMRARLRELDLNHRGTPEENQAIADALNRLNILADRSSSLAGVETDGLAGVNPVCSIPCTVRGDAHSFLRMRQFPLGS